MNDDSPERLHGPDTGENDASVQAQLDTRGDGQHPTDQELAVDSGEEGLAAQEDEPGTRDAAGQSDPSEPDGATPSTASSSAYPWPSTRDIEQEELEAGLLAHDDALDAAPWLAEEFVLWLWYRSERDFTVFRLKSGHTVDLWVDDRLVFASTDEQGSVSTFRGGAPSTLPESRLSVLSGRRIQEVSMAMRRGEVEWSFTLKVRPGELMIAGLKVPAVVKDGYEEMIYERMYLIDAVTEVLGDLFSQYFDLRTTDAWEAGERDGLKRWLMGDQDDD